MVEILRRTGYEGKLVVAIEMHPEFWMLLKQAIYFVSNRTIRLYVNSFQALCFFLIKAIPFFTWRTTTP